MSRDTLRSTSTNLSIDITDTRRHTRYGVFALIFSLIAIAMLATTVVYVVVVAGTKSAAELSSKGVFLGTLYFVAFGIALLGFICGIIGMMRKNRKTVLASVGFAVSLVTIIIMSIVVFLSMVMLR